MPTLRELLRHQSGLLERIQATDEGAPSVDEKCRLIEAAREGSSHENRLLDRVLVSEIDNLKRGLNDARTSLTEMKKHIDKLTAPPWNIGKFKSLVDTPLGQRAMVSYGGRDQVVNLVDGLELDSFECGDEVFLNNEMTAIVSLSPACQTVGETAQFDRYLDDGRLVLRWRDEELIVNVAGSLKHVELKSGDSVRVDRSAWVAYEKLERTAGQEHFLFEIPNAQPGQLGGRQGRDGLKCLLSGLQMKLVYPDITAMYGLNAQRAFLLVGPPGCGKTLLARVVCSEISITTGKQCRFAVVRPAEWFDPYVGVTERNIRDSFEALGQAAGESGIAILFLDEIESIGRIRGSMVGHHSDRALDAFLAELDGFANRGNVAVIGATNRKDLISPALLDRFDVEIPLGRPDMRGAQEIFDIHLPDWIPYSPNGEAADDTRRELIERAVSRLYSPNADNGLCQIKFRDGKHRIVKASELMSGRSIEHVCGTARELAFRRHVDTQQPGLRAEDIDQAVAEAIERMSTTLTRQNAHTYLSDLPQDVDVVAVEPVQRRVKRKHRYLNLN